MKPYAAFATAWQDLTFYKIGWGRHNLKDKNEFYHEVSDLSHV